MPLGEVGESVCPFHTFVGFEPAIEAWDAEVALVEARFNELPRSFRPISGDGVGGVCF